MTSALLSLVLLCGSQRWDSKVSTTACADRPCSAATTSTVEQLAAMKVPFARWSNHLERTAEEQVAYRVTATLVGFKLEADLDWHIVVQGTTGQTMVVEMPDPLCAPDADRAAAYKSARDHLLRYIQRPRKGKLQYVRKPFQLTWVGVLFFDRVHGQDGVAKNGVELHPVDVQ